MIYRRVLAAALLLSTLGCTATADEPRGDSATAPITLTSSDWPWWRGPTRNGIAAADQNPPLSWSDDENVVWKSPVPGRGHGSPTVVGEHIFATNETGTTFIYQASPDRFKLVGKNELDAQVFSTPTFCSSRIYLRLAKQHAGGRQEIWFAWEALTNERRQRRDCDSTRIIHEQSAART